MKQNVKLSLLLAQAGPVAWTLTGDSVLLAVSGTSVPHSKGSKNQFGPQVRLIRGLPGIWAEGAKGPHRTVSLSLPFCFEPLAEPLGDSVSLWTSVWRLCLILDSRPASNLRSFCINLGLQEEAPYQVFCKLLEKTFLLFFVCFEAQKAGGLDRDQGTAPNDAPCVGWMLGVLFVVDLNSKH